MVTAHNADSAVKLIKENIFDLILTDIRMGKTSGIDVLENAQKTSLPEEIFGVTPQFQVPSMDEEKIDLERTLDQIEKKNTI